MFAFILTRKCKSFLTDLEQAHKSNLPKFSHFSFLTQFDQRQNFSLSITVSSLLGNRLWCRKSKTSLKFCERSQRFKKLKDLSGRETTRQEGFVIMTCCRHFVITFTYCLFLYALISFVPTYHQVFCPIFSVAALYESRPKLLVSPPLAC